METKKNFVLDTNVILHDYKCIYNFEENDIYIPIVVLEEIDKFKKGSEQINFNSASLPENWTRSPQTTCLPKVSAWARAKVACAWLPTPTTPRFWKIVCREDSGSPYSGGSTQSAR